MKKRIHTYLLLIMVCLLPAMISCDGKSHEPDPIPVDPAAPRTVLVYMVAKSNLSSYSKNDLNEIRQAALNGDLGDSRLLVYCTDRDSLPRLWEIDPEANAYCRVKLKEYDDDILSVNAERMEEVIQDMKELAPAHKYGLILWGHGTGYLENGVEEVSAAPLSVSAQSAISPLSYGGESSLGRSYWMNTTSLARVLEGKGFDWVYFDCCFMAGVEVAYELRNVTDYIVGSVTELPGEGMPYNKTLKYLMTPELQLNEAAESTFNYFDLQSDVNRTCTMSVIKTAALDRLAATSRDIFTAGTQLPGDYVSQDYQTLSDHRRYGWSYYDFAHYLLALAGDNPTLAEAFNAAMDEAVQYKAATPYLWNSVALLNHSGLSTLIIQDASDSNIDSYGYRNLAWWKDVVSKRFD